MRERSEEEEKTGTTDLTKDASRRRFNPSFRAEQKQFQRESSDMTTSLSREIRYSTQIVILWMAIFSLATVLGVLALLCFLVGR